MAQGKRTSALAAIDQAVAGYEKAGATWADELVRARALQVEAGGNE